MGASKSELFNNRQKNISSIAKALGHPARVAIIEHLLQSNTCICLDFEKVIPLSQPTIAQHLAELNKAKLISGKVESNTIIYHICENRISMLQDYLNNVLFDLEKNKSASLKWRE